jgi:hypothetical protein
VSTKAPAPGLRWTSPEERHDDRAPRVRFRWIPFLPPFR